MEKLIFGSPEAHTVMLAELRKIPFAKMDDGYRFATWVYDLNVSEEKRTALLNSERGDEAEKLIEDAKAALEDIVVSEDDYLGWTVHRKDAGGIAQYHKVIEDLSMNLLMLAINNSAEQIQKLQHNSEKYFYGITSTESNDVTKRILNRHNPFADVTIKSQQFFYKTVDGSTETLFFNTNNIVENVDKNGRNMLTMRPGFSVTKEHGVVKKPMQKVTFSNTITEPIVGDEEHIYIHID